MVHAPTQIVQHLDASVYESTAYDYSSSQSKPQQIGIHEHTADSTGRGNLVEWSSTPDSEPLVQSTVSSQTLEGGANISTSLHGHHGASRPSVFNVVASDAVASGRISDTEYGPSAPLHTELARWPDSYEPLDGWLPTFNSSSAAEVFVVSFHGGIVTPQHT